jgi:branched-chain amino acid transport system permease protein
MNGSELLIALGTGTLYSIFALSVVILFKTTGQVNFAVGEVGMVPAFIGLAVYDRFHPPYIVVAIVVVVSAALLSGAINLLVIRPMGGTRAPHTQVGGVTLGISIFLAALAGVIWGEDPHAFPGPVAGRVIHLPGMALPSDYLVIVPIGAVMVILTYVFLYRSRLGLQMRATSEDAEAVRVMGVSPERVAMVAWLVAGALSGLAVLLLAPIAFVHTDMASTIVIKSFAATVIGGLFSVPGAVVGGLGLGIGETVLAIYFGQNAKDALAFFLILVVLIAKPEGLLGSKRLRRV